MPRDQQRYKDTVTQSGQSNVCDNLEDGWYRFNMAEIATSCVPVDHCGTSSTVWMKDPVPKVGETKTNEFCVNHKTGSNPNPCCLFSININVTNCNGYLVYLFSKGDLLCPSGYCTGDLIPCPNGQVSDTGFQPCIVSYPAMFGPPLLGPPTITNDGHDFTQTCAVQYNASEPDATFDLTWYFDNVVYKKLTLKSGKLSDVLTSQDWKGHIGQTLTCGVEPFFPSKTIRGKEQMSSPYIGEIQVSPSHVTVLEGEEQHLTLTSTLPTVCSNAGRAACKMDLLLAVKAGNPDDIFSKGSCGLQIKTDDWDPTTNSAVLNVTLSTVIDIVDKPDSNYHIVYRVMPDMLGHSIWDTYDMEGVNMTVKDATHKYCMETGDPEIIGFNKNTLYVAVFHGDYYMYDGVNPQGKRLTVETRLWNPSRNAASVCAVGVAYDDTLITVDMCSSRVKARGATLSRAGANPDSLQVYTCGSAYEIVSGDGIRVSIVVHDLNLDVKLHVPPSFSNGGTGVCTYAEAKAVMDGAKLNTYRPLHNNILQRDAVPFINTQQVPVDSSTWYCRCGVVDRGCSPFGRVSDPRSPVSVDAKGNTVLRSGCRKATPKPLTFDPHHPTGVFYQPPNTIYRLPTPPVGFWASQIETTCRGYLANYSSPFCLKENGRNLETFVTHCKNDHMGSGTYDYIDSSLQAFEWSCEETILSNTSYYTTTSSGAHVPPPEVTSHVCPNLCSRSGQCVSGKCQCDQGYDGTDCSYSTSKPPELLEVVGGSTCPMSRGDCTKPTLAVKNIPDTSFVRAKLTLLEIHYGRPEPTNKTFEIPAVVENRYSVLIPLSAFIATLKDQTAFRLDIQLTVDGKTYTKPLQYFVFDDKCHYCNTLLGGCLERENACKINGRCYASKEPNPSKVDEVCDPRTAIMAWTKVADVNPVVVGK